MKKAICIILLISLILSFTSCNISNTDDSNKEDIYQKIGPRNFYEDSDYRYSFGFEKGTRNYVMLKEDKKSGVRNTIDKDVSFMTDKICDKIFYYEKYPKNVVAAYNTENESIVKYDIYDITDVRRSNIKKKDSFTYVFDNYPENCFVGENGFYLVYNASNSDDYVIYKLNNNFEVIDRVCIMENMKPEAFTDTKIYTITDDKEFYVYDIEKKETEKVSDVKGYDICGYVGDGKFIIYVFEEEAGTKVSIFDINTLDETYMDVFINGEVAYDKDNIYMCTVDKGVLKIPKDTLVSETIYEYNGKYTYSPVLSGDTLYFAEISKEQNPAYEIKSVKIK